MSIPVYPTAFLVDMLSVLIEGIYPAAPAAAKIKLYKNDVSPDAGMPLGLFEEADFATYVAKALVMTAPSLNDQGLVVSKSGLCNWQTLPGVAEQTVYGIYITNADDDNLIAAQRFDTPQIVGGAYPQAISGIWRVSEPYSGIGWIDVEG